MDEIAATAYGDFDLVYVDPDAKSVVGRVEWGKSGNPRSLSVKENAATAEHRKFRKVYPWGTYRSMRNVYQLEGKVKRTDPERTLDDILPKALETAFWD